MMDKQEAISKLEKELNVDISLYDLTKALLNVRCTEYCPIINIDNVLDAWEWYLFENDFNEEIEPTLEQLDKIMNVDFLKELHEKIWQQISIWLCDQIDKEVSEELK